MAQKPRRPSRPKRTAKPRGAPQRKDRSTKRPTQPARQSAAKARSAPVAKPVREEFDEETVCSIEFLQDNRSFIARLDTNRGGMREHRAPSFSDLLELVSEDLREEFLEI